MLATTITVNDFSDLPDDDLFDGMPGASNGNVTLRAAVQHANTLTGPVEILLPEGVYDLSQNGTESGSAAAENDLDITGEVMIVGAGAGLSVIDAGGVFGLGDRLFEVLTGGDLTLERLTLTGGVSQGADAVSQDDGGAVAVRDGANLVLDQVSVVGNEAIGSNASGGAILFETGGGGEIRDSVITDNEAGRFSGGVFARSGVTNSQVTVSGSVIADNRHGESGAYEDLLAGSSRVFTTGGNNLIGLGALTTDGFTFGSLGDVQGDPDLIVTSVADRIDDTDDGYARSLREAAIEANDASGADEVWLPAMQHSLSRVGGSEDAGLTGDLDITGEVTIVGAGAGLSVIDAGGVFGLGDRLFEVLTGGDLTLERLTLTGGVSQGADAVSQDDGGAVAVRDGANLVLDQVSVVGNEAIGSNASGGAILFETGGGGEIRDSVITDNEAGRFSGGVFARSGVTNSQVTVSGSVIADNRHGESGAYEDLLAGSSRVFTTGGNNLIGLGALTTDGFTFGSLGDVQGDPDLIVTSVADRIDDTDDGYARSLREAAIEANDASGADEVWLPAMQHSLSRVGGSEDAGLTGDLDITGEVTIVGAGAGLSVIDAGGVFGLGDRLFEVLTGGDLTLERLTLTGGVSQGADAVSQDDGGAVAVRDGANLVLDQVSVVGNEAIGSNASGGAILFETGGGGEIRDSVITDNEAGRFSGGVFARSGVTNSQVTVSGSVIADNRHGESGAYEDLLAGSSRVFTTGGNNLIGLGALTTDGFTFGSLGDVQGDPDLIVTSVADRIDDTDDGYARSLREAAIEANDASGADEAWLPAFSYVVLDTSIDIDGKFTARGAGEPELIAPAGDAVFALDLPTSGTTEYDELVLKNVAVTGEAIEALALSAPTPTTPADSSPALPAGTDEFDPATTAAPVASDAPLIAEMSDTAGQDQSLTISGYLLSTATVNDETMGADTKVLVYGRTADGDLAYRYATVLRVDGSDILDNAGNNAYQVAMIVLPEDLPEWSTYMLWIGNDNGWSEPQVVNRTEAWWGQGHTLINSNKQGAVRPGDTISLYGRNLVHDNTAGGDGHSVFVEARDATGALIGNHATFATLVVTSDEATPYRVDLELPEFAGVSDIDHLLLYAHNGHGGEYGWSEPVEIAVDAAAKPLFDATAIVGTPSSERTVVTLTDGTDLGTYSQNLSPLSASETAENNASNLQDILDHFRNKSDDYQLYLPAGDYYINQEIIVKGNITLYGDGPQQTKIIAVEEDENGQYDDTAFDRYVIQIRTDVSDVSLRSLAVLAGTPDPNTPAGDPIDILNPVSLGIEVVTDASGYAELSDEGEIQFETPIPALVYIGAKNVELDDVLLHSGSSHSGTAQVAPGELISFTRSARSINADTDDFYLTNSTIIGDQVALGNADDVRIDHVDFRLRNDANTAIALKNPRRVSVTNSTAQDDDTSDPMNLDGYGTGRFIVVSSSGKAPEHLYFGANETTDLSRNLNADSANEGEQILFEETGSNVSAAAGEVDQVDSNGVVTFTSLGQTPATGSGKTLVVVDGSGLGQYRTGTVALVPGTTDQYTFDPDDGEEWALSPDATSTVVVSHVPQKAVVYDNKFDAKDDAQTLTIKSGSGYEKPITSTGIMVGDGGLDLVIVGNEVQQTNSGINVLAGDFGNADSDDSKDEFAVPLYWTLVAENSIGESFLADPTAQEAYDARTVGGIGVGSGATDAGHTTLGIHVTANVIKVKETTRLQQEGDPDNFYITSGSTGLGTSAFYSHTAEDPNDNTPASHAGPTYVTFDNNDVSADTGYAANAFTRNTGPAGGRHYLVDGYAEHLTFYGNTFSTTPEDPADPTGNPQNANVAFRFNLLSDQTVAPDLENGGTPTWGNNDEPENWLTAALPDDYRFHVLEGNTFESAGAEYIYGTLGGQEISTSAPSDPDYAQLIDDANGAVDAYFAALATTEESYTSDDLSPSSTILVDALRIVGINVGQAAGTLRVGSVSSSEGWLDVSTTANGETPDLENLVVSLDLEIDLDHDDLSTSDNHETVVTVVFEEVDDLGSVVGSFSLSVTLTFSN